MAASAAPLNAPKAARYYPALLRVEGPTTGASQLSLIANTLQQGELHNAVQNLAGRVIRKGVAEAAPGG
jgi:hypothetical protein